MNIPTSETGSTQNVHGEYYPHIDGIRALAVIPVVLFHVLASLCPGGFAGVDVFFVISGYLITGGILRDLQKDRFTIRNFYYRRIRRIMPAYFAMIAGVFVTGLALYYSQPLILLGDAVTAGTLFVANLHFWMLGGDYFAPNLHSQALLHLWSLSVEEQFYLFIPLLCAILWKFNRRCIAPVLAIIAVLSAVGACHAVMAGKQNNAFYFIQYRAWELLVGSLLALLPRVAPLPESGRSDRAPLLRETRHAVLAATGLLAVLIPYVSISSSTPFPGLAAMPSVVGTGLLIRYGQSGCVARFLSNRCAVGAGKISYSLYLWHWPVTVFWKYAVYDQLFLYDYLGMLLLSLLLGYLSWKYVETPVRTSAAWTQQRAFAFAFSGSALLVALGTLCVYCKGWPSTLHPRANEVAVIAEVREPFLFARSAAIARRLGFLKGPLYGNDSGKRTQALMEHGKDGRSSIGASGTAVVFLLGDSHAGALRYGFDQLLRKEKLAGYAISCSSKDLFNLRLPEAQDAIKTLEEMPQVSQVILAEMWVRSLSATKKQPDAVYAQIEEFSARIKAMGKTLYIATDIPHYRNLGCDFESRSLIITPRAQAHVLFGRQQSEKEYDLTQGQFNRKLGEICLKTGAVMIPLHQAFKSGDTYTAFDEAEARAVPLYRDSDHLYMEGSVRGARFILRYLFPEKHF